MAKAIVNGIKLTNQSVRNSSQEVLKSLTICVTRTFFLRINTTLIGLTSDTHKKMTLKIPDNFVLGIWSHKAMLRVTVYIKQCWGVTVLVCSIFEPNFFQIFISSLWFKYIYIFAFPCWSVAYSIDSKCSKFVHVSIHNYPYCLSLLLQLIYLI